MRGSIVKWDYSKSVQKMRPLVVKWKTVTEEMLEELRIARNELSKTGRPKSGNNFPFSWVGYLKDIGLEKRTVNKWLEAKKELAEVQKRKLIESDTCTVADIEELAESGRKFGTIYADPPWQYNNQATRSSTDENYPTMNLDEICSLPVSELADENAHLHLWTTNAFLREAFSVMDAWDFEYKSCFVWVKPQMGIGNYWRVSHEFLLLGTRGKCPFADHSLKSWASLDRGEHSSKPGQVRAWIEKASPGPYIELFARQVYDGWAAWGNEIDRSRSGLFHSEVESI
jgi:N6-adenosine-specific RNA methylase IME4